MRTLRPPTDSCPDLTGQRVPYVDNEGSHLEGVVWVMVPRGESLFQHTTETKRKRMPWGKDPQDVSTHYHRAILELDDGTMRVATTRALMTYRNEQSKALCRQLAG